MFPFVSPNPENMIGSTNPEEILSMNGDEENCLCVNLPGLLESRNSGSLNVLLQNLPGAVYCCSPAPSTTLKFVSEQIQQIVGHPVGDLASGRISWTDLIHPDDREWTMREVLKAASERTEWSLEYRIRDAEGNERWVCDQGRGVYQESELVCLQGFVSDVTETRLSRRKIQRSEERFRGTFENAAVGIAHVGLDGRWLCVNERLCQIVGYSHEELSEKTFGHITHPDDLDADWGQAMLLMAGKIRSYSMEKRYFRKDGSIVWINLTGSLVRDTNGEPEYFIAIVEDIDDRKKAERALRERTEEAEKRAVQLRTLTFELINAEESERRRVAQFLHDHLQQLLVAAGFSLTSLIGKTKDASFLKQLTRARGLTPPNLVVMGRVPPGGAGTVGYHQLGGRRRRSPDCLLRAQLPR